MANDIELGVRLTADGKGVYPRVCGGTPADAKKAAAPRGLSPRVRGNHEAGRRDHPRVGSIPACAGEPVMVVGGMSSSWVYPRVCGGTEAA